jgi:predicted short-subunit dehydrogenase-like oxidoreductase (DUF2520 family)
MVEKRQTTIRLHWDLPRATDWSASPIGIAGGGRVGQAIGRLLYENNQPVVCVASRTIESARAAAIFIGSDVEPVSLAELAERAPRVLICVPDSALEALAGSLELRAGIALHTCGARGADALGVLAKRNVSCGAIHPLQTVADPASGVRGLRGIAFAIAGDAPALAWAEQIVHAAHGRALLIADPARPLYHSAAVMASNYVVALMAAAEELMGAAGIAPADARYALAPLASASLENALRVGPAAALTGPIERGDAGTVATHLGALRAASDTVATLYRAAGLQTLAVARQRGLAEEPASRMERLLREKMD